MPLPPQLQTSRFRNALTQRELIICVGPLISQAAGFPSLGDLVHACLDACEEANFPIDRREVELFVDQGKVARAFEGIENVLGTALFRQVIADGLTCDFSKRPLAKACLALEKLAPALFQVATTNLDRQLEVALRPAGWWPAKPSSNIAQQARVLVPLHGEIAEHTTWVLSSRDLTCKAKYQHPEVRKQVEGLFVSRTWLFIGYTPSDELFEHLVDQLGHPPGEGNAPSHLALVPHGSAPRDARHFRDRGVTLVEVGEAGTAANDGAVEGADAKASDAGVKGGDKTAEGVAETTATDRTETSATYAETAGDSAVPRPDAAAYDKAVAACLDEVTAWWKDQIQSSGTEADLPATPTENPYPGLHAFTAENRRYFFGRAREVSQAAKKLGSADRRGGWLIVEGPSGVGKSSFVRAGLAPAIVRGEHMIAGGTSQWRMATAQPGREPLASLATAVHGAFSDVARADETSAHLASRMEHTETALADFLHTHLSPGESFLLVLDQFEEAVTIAVAHQREALSRVLANVVRDPKLPVYVVMTLRSDCKPAFQTELKEFGGELNELASQYLLPPLAGEQLRQAIEEPARQAGYRLGPLSKRILEDVGNLAVDNEPSPAKRQGGGERVALPDSTLPLVAHVLHALARHANDGELSLEAYEELGGVAGALTQSADALLGQIEGEGFRRELVKQVLLSLTNLQDDGRDFRRARTKRELLDVAGGGERAEKLLRRLSGQPEGTLRLVTIDGAEEPRVDLVHDALLVRWKTLREWLREHRESALRAEERRKRWRLVAVVAVLSFVILLLWLVVLWAFEQRDAAEEARVRADQLREQADEAREQAQVNLRSAGGVVNKILFEVLPKLEAIPGTSDVRKEVHNLLSEAQDKLLAGASDDSGTLRSRMAQHLDRCKIAMSFDDLERAHRECTGALELAERLQADNGNSANRDLSVSLGRLGDVERAAGNLGEARKHFQRSLDIFEEMEGQDPKDASLKRDLSVSLNKLGDVERATGNFSGARKHLRRSLEIVEEMEGQDPKSTSLSVSLNKLGDVESAAGNFVGARKHFQRSLESVEEMVGQDPKNASLKRELSISLIKLGDVEREAGNLGAARKLIQRSLEIFEEMVGQDPRNAILKFDLVLSHGKLFLLEQGQDAVAYKRHLLAADKLLTELADSGHLEGWAKREEVRQDVTRRLRELD